MSEIVYQHLQPVINLGLDEFKFWEMTVAEVSRWEEGAMWRLKSKAQFDYVLADLIGISSARMMSDDVKYPSLEDAYPNLFEQTPDEIMEQKKEEEIATQNLNRFMEFAMKHNAMMTKGESDGS